MIRRMTNLTKCGQCGRKFTLFEMVHYLGIDNNCFCADCREQISPKEPDDLNNQGGWVPTLCIGERSEARNNLLYLIQLYNSRLEDWEYDQEIEISMH